MPRDFQEGVLWRRQLGSPGFAGEILGRQDGDARKPGAHLVGVRPFAGRSQLRLFPTYTHASPAATGEVRSLFLKHTVFRMLGRSASTARLDAAGCGARFSVAFASQVLQLWTFSQLEARKLGALVLLLCITACLGADAESICFAEASTGPLLSGVV